MSLGLEVPQCHKPGHLGFVHAHGVAHEAPAKWITRSRVASIAQVGCRGVLSWGVLYCDVPCCGAAVVVIHGNNCTRQVRQDIGDEHGVRRGEDCRAVLAGLVGAQHRGPRPLGGNTSGAAHRIRCANPQYRNASRRATLPVACDDQTGLPGAQPRPLHRAEHNPIVAASTSHDGVHDGDAAHPWRNANLGVDEAPDAAVHIGPDPSAAHLLEAPVVTADDHTPVIARAMRAWPRYLTLARR